MVRKSRLLVTTVAALAIAMLAYRVYLAWAASRLAASGTTEEALFVLMVDPLWRLEFAVARLLGDNGPIAAMNALALFWGAIVAITTVVAARGIRSRAPR